MPVTVAHPLKIVGRVVLGPRRIHNGYARIVATSNGSGRIELFDTKSCSWSDASGLCGFCEVWSGAPILDSGHLHMLAAAES